MVTEIIAVGTEILMGQIVNTNARYIAKKLTELGIDCYFQTVVGDNKIRLTDALNIASERSDICILTGGLGPTEDDITKETVVEFNGLECVLDEKCLNNIKEIFAKRDMPKNNIKQAMVPKGCIILYNENGTAPGVIIEQNEKVYIILPGPPGEMSAMFDKYVYPYLQSKSGDVLYSRTLRLTGIGESAAIEMLGDIITKQTDPTIGIYAGVGEVTLRITTKCPATSADEVGDARIAPVEKAIRDVLGDYVYGVGETNNMYNVVFGELKRRGLKIGFAESCTGGLAAARMTAVSGASACFECGVVTYSNEQKVKLLNVSQDTLTEFGAVSRETALEMSRGIRDMSGADIGISITGIAGPGGGSAEKPVGLVYIGICADGIWEAYKFNFNGKRETVREQSVVRAYDVVRKYLLNSEYQRANCNNQEV